MISSFPLTRNSHVIVFPNKCEMLISFNSVAAVVYGSICYVNQTLLDQYKKTVSGHLSKFLTGKDHLTKRSLSAEDIPKAIGRLEDEAYPNNRRLSSDTPEEERATFG